MLCYESWHKTDGLKQNCSKFNCYGLNKRAKKSCTGMFNKMKFYRKLKNNLINVKF